MQLIWKSLIVCPTNYNNSVDTVTLVSVRLQRYFRQLRAGTDTPRRTQNLATLGVLEGPMKVGFEYTWPAVYVRGWSPIEMQSPTHSDLIGHSMSVPSPVLSPSSIPPPP